MLDSLDGYQNTTRSLSGGWRIEGPAQHYAVMALQRDDDCRLESCCRLLQNSPAFGREVDEVQEREKDGSGNVYMTIAELKQQEAERRAGTFALHAVVPVLAMQTVRMLTG